MATFADAAADIRARFEGAWAGLHADVPILWPNERLAPAPDPNTDQNGKQGWVAFEVCSGVERVVGFGGVGNNLYRQSGETIIRCFVPVTIGETALRTLAAGAASIFRGWQNGNLKFFAVSTTGGEGSEDGNWASLDVLCSFTYDLTG